MEYLQFKTRGNAKPEGKPKVYLTCHPMDVSLHLDDAVAALHAASDCVVYYAANMKAGFEDENWKLDLGRMQLFVVPVTFRLLTEASRAMDFDVPFAKENRIPILPLMMEPGIDEFYARRFGDLQYLSPLGDGRGGGVRFEDKLGQYLESVLIGEEQAKRIREAFDAYVFLSYRKVDRKLADDFMRMVHSDPRCRDIALWYDEFLTPGESFKENIDRILGSSKLFTLLVTPNVLERRDGKPNFVMGVEYPAAHRAGLEIVAAEGEATDISELAKHFDGIPSPLSMKDDEARIRLIDSMARCATEVNDSDPLHNYLIGLAYLKGIDVEVDVSRGVMLVTKAAEAGQEEAMERLIRMYGNGDGVVIDYENAFKWAYRVYEIRKEKLGECHQDTLEVVRTCESLKKGMGDFYSAEQFGYEAWRLSFELFGEHHPKTIMLLLQLAFYQNKRGNMELTARILEKSWNLIQDEQNNHDAFGVYLYELLERMNDLLYEQDLSKFGSIIEFLESQWLNARETLGERHPATLLALTNLAATYCNVGNYQKAADLGEKAYTLFCDTYGERHPNSIATLALQAGAKAGLGDIRVALELADKAYLLSCEVMGERNPNTLEILNSLALLYLLQGEFETAVKLCEKAWDQRCEVLGERHPDTLTSLFNLVLCKRKLVGSIATSKLAEEAFNIHNEVLGQYHPNTISLLETLASIRNSQGDNSSAVELAKRAWHLRCETQGEDHPDTLESLANLDAYRESLIE